MRFGFLAQPVGTGQLAFVRLAGLASRLLGERVTGGASAEGHLKVPVLRQIVSPTGARADGDVRYLPYVAEDMLRHSGTATDVVTNEVRSLIKDGAQIVGLGGASSIIGERGQRIADAVSAPVTSGNSLTAYAALETVRAVAERLGLEPGAQPLTIVGYPGSIGLVLAKLLLRDGHRLDLVHRPSARSADSLLRYLDRQYHDQVTLISDPDDMYRRGRLLVAASSVGGVIDPSRLRPGSVVVDVALPRDVPEPPRDRADVLTLDGGLVSAADPGFRVDGNPYAPTRQLNGCLAETLVLALEGRAEPWSIGRLLDPDKVLAIGAMAARHGLLPAPYASFGRPVRDDAIDRLVPDRPRRTAVAQELAEATGSAFRRRINPPLAGLFETHDIDHVFTSAHGCTLTTADGVDYLDFVAGYGCLNLGHNPPGVVERLRGFLDSGSPTFVQYVSMPVHSAELAERLCDVAPGDLERVFFSNSGAESVEAALKLARAATGRTRLVYVENSYHGKTLGALSVTGRRSHRAGFGPLVGDCVAVPHGDLPALAAALDGAAAFIVEPVLGEGGVVLPPDGYLRGAQDLCRAAGAAFVVDEIQTGLGRTGAMFACEHWGLEPDILCLAKSLSGGLVPIGATLSRADLWDAAYGSANRAVLHSSTFGGGNFAAAAGLAALDEVERLDLPAHAALLGRELRDGLAAACAPYSFVREVRGIGMMNAIEFDTGLSGAFAAAAEDALTRLPGDLWQLADLLGDDTRGALAEAGRAVEENLGDLLTLRLVRALARDHRILTFVTANHTRVLRIQPPLVLEPHEADRFVAAVAEAAAGLSFHADLAARVSGAAPVPTT